MRMSTKDFLTAATGICMTALGTVAWMPHLATSGRPQQKAANSNGDYNNNLVIVKDYTTKPEGLVVVADCNVGKVIYKVISKDSDEMSVVSIKDDDTGARNLLQTICKQKADASQNYVKNIILMNNGESQPQAVTAWADCNFGTVIYSDGQAFSATRVTNDDIGRGDRLRKICAQAGAQYSF